MRTPTIAAFLSLAALLPLPLVAGAAPRHGVARPPRKGAKLKVKVSRARKPAAPKAVKLDPKADPLKLPRDQAQALVTVGKLKSFYDPRNLALPPVVCAPSAILVDAETGQVLWEKNADVRRPMASTTKIMTALLFVEHTKPDDIVTCLDPNITKIEESSLHIKPWEKFTAENLLYGTMLRSGNDGAVVMAEYVGKTVPRFAAMMNERARELGATNTNFVNPNGLHDPRHYTTARDLALIACAAMKNPRFEAAVSEPVRVIQRSINTGDSVIKAKVKPYFYDIFPGADGVKTGYTRAARHCFVGSATRNGRRILGVALGAVDSASRDMIPMLGWAFARWQSEVIAQKGSSPTTVQVRGGEKPTVNAVLTQDVTASVDTADEQQGRSVHADPHPLANLRAPIRAGQTVGSVTYSLNGTKIGDFELVAKDDVPAAPLPVTAGFAAPWTLPLGISGGLVVLIGWGYVAASSKSNRRRRNRLASSR